MNIKGELLMQNRAKEPGLVTPDRPYRHGAAPVRQGAAQIVSRLLICGALTLPGCTETINQIQDNIISKIISEHAGRKNRNSSSRGQSKKSVVKQVKERYDQVNRRLDRVASILASVNDESSEKAAIEEVFQRRNSAEPAATLKTLGLQYELQQIKEPRINRIHVLRVNFEAGKIKPAVVVGADPDGDGPAETALTSPLKLAAGPAVVAFINSNPWDSFPDAQGRRNRRWFAGQPVDISGLAAPSGRIRSPTQSHATSVWFDGAGRLRLGVAPGDGQEQPEEERLTEGMAGFGLIMKAGKVVVGEGGAVHPRTSIGVDRTGKIAWLVVVDGRQRGFSEGMNLHELALRMKQLGCWDAMNMDGGGSSVMGLLNEEGKMQVFNSPSDRRRGRRSVRPLPLVLTLRKVGGEKQAPTDKPGGKPD